MNVIGATYGGAPVVSELVRMRRKDARSTAMEKAGGESSRVKAIEISFIQQFQINPEERVPTAKFGCVYDQYRNWKTRAHAEGLSRTEPDRE